MSRYSELFSLTVDELWWCCEFCWFWITSAVYTVNSAIRSILFDANFVQISDEQCDVHEDMFLFCRLFCLTERSLSRVLTRHLETRVEMHKCPTLKLEIGPATVFFMFLSEHPAGPSCLYPLLLPRTFSNPGGVIGCRPCRLVFNTCLLPRQLEKNILLNTRLGRLVFFMYVLLH